MISNPTIKTYMLCVVRCLLTNNSYSAEAYEQTNLKKNLSRFKVIPMIMTFLFVYMCFYLLYQSIQNAYL